MGTLTEPKRFPDFADSNKHLSFLILRHHGHLILEIL